MIRSSLRPCLVGIAVGSLCFSSLAEAQWVLLAKRAIGRVEQMSQTQPNGPSYDTAVVLLEAPPDKVYAAVVRGVKNAQGITVTKEDAAELLIQFTNGQQIAGIKVSGLGEGVSHLLVSSAHSGTQPDAAKLVSDTVLRVCKEMSVICSPAEK